MLGVSKQAVQQAKKRQEAFDEELSALIVLADELKEEHPGCGVEKMYYTLKPSFMGRDTFCELFMSLGYGVKRMKNYHRTTISGKIYYPNYIEGMEVLRPFQVIQSDITYFNLHHTDYYLVFIIDVYTRIIVGYAVNNHLRVEANLQALAQALKVMKVQPWSVIHHSDRGSQYSSKAYRKQLEDHSIHLSMGKVAWENPYAERINGIIKNEYLKRWLITDFADLKRKVKKAVHHYNYKRMHRAFKMKYSPMQWYENLVHLPLQDRPRVVVYSENQTNDSTSDQTHSYPELRYQEAHFCPINLNSNPSTETKTVNAI
jgi:transposase InsO family protein